MKKKMSNRDKTFWAVVIPVVVLFFAFNTLPMIKGVIYSFTNYKGYGSYDYVGLRNYTDLFTDARVGKSYLFTFKYAIAGTVLKCIKPCNGSCVKQQYPRQECIKRCLFRTEYPWRTGYWLHFQLYFYIYSAGSRKYLQHRFLTKQYSGE